MHNLINSDNPICLIKIETSGFSIKNDRIIELYIEKHFKNSETTVFHRVLNPDVEISPEASSANGYSNEALVGKPLFKDIAKELKDFIDNSTLVGFNIKTFDLPFIIEELYRNGITFNYKKPSIEIIDVMNVFKSVMKPNSLGFAFKTFFDKQLPGSSAIDKAVASKEVLTKCLEEYGFSENIQLVDIKAIEQSKGFDLSNKILLEDNIFKFNFGKHFGKNILEVFDQFPNYFGSLMDLDMLNTDSKIVLTILFNHLKSNK